MIAPNPAQNALGSPIATPLRQRGVYHRTGCNGGTTFELRDSHGVVQFEVCVAAEHCTPRTVRWLNTVLDAIDPPPSPLKIV